MVLRMIIGLGLTGEDVAQAFSATRKAGIAVVSSTSRGRQRGSRYRSPSWCHTASASRVRC
jgi:hypothetical protein